MHSDAPNLLAYASISGTRLPISASTLNSLVPCTTEVGIGVVNEHATGGRRKHWPLIYIGLLYKVAG